MIKFAALILMILDHIGHMLNSGIIKNSSSAIHASVFLNTIGRLSMPLFAYCIARGFNHYLKKGNLKKYFINISIMAVTAQFPYWCFRYYLVTYGLYSKVSIFDVFMLNIGFTWLVSLLLLCALHKINFFSTPENDLLETKSLTIFTKKNLIFSGLAVAICVASIFSRVEYSLYGVLYPVIFYYCCFKYNSQIMLFICNCIQYFIYCLSNGVPLINHSSQIFAVFVVFLLLYLQKIDNSIRLPKFIFYWFYPVHLAIISGLYLTVF